MITHEGQVLDTAAVAKPKGKVRKLSLTSPAKIGAARKSRPAASPAKVEAAERRLRVRYTNRAVKLAECDWSTIKGVDAARAQQYAEMLASGEGVTPREAEQATGLNMAQRWHVEKVLGAAGAAVPQYRPELARRLPTMVCGGRFPTDHSVPDLRTTYMNQAKA